VNIGTHPLVELVCHPSSVVKRIQVAGISCGCHRRHLLWCPSRCDVLLRTVWQCALWRIFPGFVRVVDW